MVRVVHNSRLQSALGLNWTPWNMERPCLVHGTAACLQIRTRSLTSPGDADEWRAYKKLVRVPPVSCMRGSGSPGWPTAMTHVRASSFQKTGGEVESRKEPDLIVVVRRRDDAGTKGRLHRWGRCSERWAQEGPRQRRFRWARAAGSAGGLFTGVGCAVGGRPTSPSTAPTKMQSRAAAATGRNLPRSVRLRRQVRRSGCSRSVQRCGVSIGPDGAAPAGPATPPAVALPTRAMPAPPSEARCVRSNSIRARW